MAAIAREAGISKALLYHYFPSKQAYFVATLEQQAGGARRGSSRSTRRSRRSSSSRARSTRSSAGSSENADGLRQRSCAARRRTRRCASSSIRCAAAPPTRSSPGSRPAAPPPPALRAAVHGWLWFMDGVLHRLARAPRHGARRSCSASLLGTLLGAVTASGRPAGRAPARLADLLEVDDEDQRLVRADVRARALRAVREVGRDDEQRGGRPPSCPATPWSQPGMTWPAPSGNVNGSLPRSHDASNCAPVDHELPTYCTETVSPALAALPLPLTMSVFCSSAGGVARRLRRPRASRRGPC